MFALVRYICAGGYGKVKDTSKDFSSCYIRKLDADSYCDLRDGVVKKFVKHEGGRMANPRGVSARCEMGRWVCRANSMNVSHFLTLTFARPCVNHSELCDHFRKFWQRLKRAQPLFYGYIAAFEPHGMKEGKPWHGWHVHVLLLSYDSKLFIDEKRTKFFERVWGLGRINVQRPKSVDDLGSYLIAYLTKLDGKKSAALRLYPKSFRFIRWSYSANKPYQAKVMGDLIDMVDRNKEFLDTLYYAERSYEFENTRIYVHTWEFKVKKDLPNSSCQSLDFNVDMRSNELGSSVDIIPIIGMVELDDNLLPRNVSYG